MTYTGTVSDPLSLSPPPMRRKTCWYGALLAGLQRTLVLVGMVLVGLVPAGMVLLMTSEVALAQPLINAKYGNQADPFYPLDAWQASPSPQRLASGAPGPEYWQQQASYEIEVTLDDGKQSLSGVSRLRYRNNSPHTLEYLWFQLDQNRYRPDSASAASVRAPALDGSLPVGELQSILARREFPGGYDISSVTNQDGAPLPYTIRDTMMRVDLPEPLAPGQETVVHVDFRYNLVNAKRIRSRSGYEYFAEGGNYIYQVAQWFPRIAAYTDYAGWRVDSYLGTGEFTLEFGDYLVKITAPADMLVPATGELQNPHDVLSETQRERLAAASTADKPMFVVTPDEARVAETERSADQARTGGTPIETKTWVYQASNVRDFAFAASRKFIWDAVGHPVADRTVMAMSFYPNEAEPLWSQYSTAAVAHTLDVYGRYTFDYPYPVAISINGPVYGMEYPMICFNGPRPEADGTYRHATKYDLISVVIHEVGHNWFPMIVNNDERTWGWMDEGLNTFLQYLAEQEWEEKYPSRRGEPAGIAKYMAAPNQRPIMTPADSILQLGHNAYGKPAAALNVLRETVLGRETFDFAFKQYANRWKFKRPTPEDFFRTIEDASGENLDWFWRGWFYSTEHVDLAISHVRLYQIDSGDPDEAAERKRQEESSRQLSLSEERNQTIPRKIDATPALQDFYNDPATYDPLAVSDEDRKKHQEWLQRLDDEQRALLKRQSHFYVLTIRNVGGLISPIIYQVYYDDGTSERVQLPVSIWRPDTRSVDKLLISDRRIQRIELDPQRQTADADESNNHWPPRVQPQHFRLTPPASTDPAAARNPMQRAGLGATKDGDGE